MKKTLLLFLLVLTGSLSAQHFTADEKNLIQSGGANTMLKVIQVTDSTELKILKAVSTNVNAQDPLTELLAQRMFLSMRDPANPGIGIAAPQVGINRNMFWVQRFDKEGEPFELYLNPEITWCSALLRKGTEGCLSIPDISGEVLRHYTIQISYQDKKGQFHQELVEGFTAVVFQHEYDHIKGILFTDRMTEQQQKEFSEVSREIKLFLETKVRRQ